MLRKILITFVISVITFIFVSFFTILISLYMNHSLNLFGLNLTILHTAGEIRGMEIKIDWLKFIAYVILVSSITSLISFIILKRKKIVK